MVNINFFWDLYKFTLKSPNIYHKIMAVELTRCWEYQRFLERLLKKDIENDTPRILYIGATKNDYFSLYSAKLFNKGNVYVLDIDPSVKILKKYSNKLGYKNLHIKVGDATNLPFKDSTFDLIICISTIEHIPNDGDIKTIKEIARTLRNKGLIYITCPGNVSYQEGKWDKWFQRSYDLKNLKKRIIDSSPELVCDSIEIWEPCIFYDFFYKIPKFLRYLFARFHIIIYYLDKYIKFKSKNRIFGVWLKKT